MTRHQITSGTFSRVPGDKRVTAVPSRPAAPEVTRPTLPQLRALYPEVGAMADHMLAELWDNRGKGDRDGWMAASPDQLMADVWWHAAKLALAAGGRVEPHRVAEYCADVANMAMMLADRMGVL